MQGLPASAFNLTKSQSILNEVGQAQIALEADLNTSIAELDDGSGSGKVTKGPVKSSGRDKTNQDGGASGSDQTSSSVSNSADTSNSTLVTTYEALRENQKQIYYITGKLTKVASSL